VLLSKNSKFIAQIRYSGFSVVSSRNRFRQVDVSFQSAHQAKYCTDARSGKMIDVRGGHAWPPVETGGFKMIDEILSQYLLLIFYPYREPVE
jgi:hypothetical protein